MSLSQLFVCGGSKVCRHKGHHQAHSLPENTIPDLGGVGTALVAKEDLFASSGIAEAVLMAGDDSNFKTLGVLSPKENFGRLRIGLRVLVVAATVARVIMVSLVSASARRALASASAESPAGLCVIGNDGLRDHQALHECVHLNLGQCKQA